MTNCVYVRHQGKKTKEDISYVLKTFQNITKDEWLLMCNVKGNKLENENAITTNNQNPSKEELRNLRNLYF